MTKCRFCRRNCQKHCNSPAKPATPRSFAKLATDATIPATLQFLQQFSRRIFNAPLQIMPLNLRIQFLRFFLATPAHGHPCYHKTRGKTCDSLKPSQCECNSCCSNCSSCSIVTANPVPHLIRAILLNDSHTDCNSCGSNRNSRTSSL